jgi:hypothetical protein
MFKDNIHWFELEMRNYRRYYEYKFIDENEGMNVKLILSAMIEKVCLIIITNPAINDLHALSILSLLLILKYNILDPALGIYYATPYSLLHILQ